MASSKTKPEPQQGALAPTSGTAITESAGGFADYANKGLEGLSKDDLAIPFLIILQSNSPQVKRSEGEYVEGAAEGMLYNTVTKALLDPIKDKVLVVPCAYARHFVEWKVREGGGGFVKQHAPDPALLEGCIRDEKGRDILPNGHQLNDTRSFYVMLLVGDAAPAPAFLTMTSTQIKKSKQWLMQQNLLKLRGPAGDYTPPMFASKWQITTVPESNEKGSWMGWAFAHDGYLSGTTDPVFMAAMEFHKAVASGTVKADLSRAEPIPAEREPGSDDDGDGDVQF